MYNRDGIFQAPQAPVLENSAKCFTWAAWLLLYWGIDVCFFEFSRGFSSILYQFQKIREFQKFEESGILKGRLFTGTTWLRSWTHFSSVSFSSDLRSCYWVYSTRKCQVSLRSWILQSLCLQQRHAEGSMYIHTGIVKIREDLFM